MAKKPYKPSTGDRVILAILRAFKKKPKKVKSFTTTRTKSVSGKLREAGISQEKINLLRKKTRSK